MPLAVLRHGQGGRQVPSCIGQQHLCFLKDGLRDAGDIQLIYFIYRHPVQIVEFSAWNKLLAFESRQAIAKNDKKARIIATDMSGWCDRPREVTQIAKRRQHAICKECTPILIIR